MKKPAIIRIPPFMFHTIILGLFASLIGPFGGFFASGFKRAFKIKVKINLECLLMFLFFLGFWGYHSWTWWISGPIRLPTSYGNFCQCLHTVIYQVANIFSFLAILPGSSRPDFMAIPRRSTIRLLCFECPKFANFSTTKNANL